MARILVVDDEKAFCVMVHGMLDSLGHDCIEALDGVEAEAQCKRGKVDMVLLDIIMPGQDGIVTMKNLQRDHPAVKIVAISGGGMVSAAEYLKAAKHLGAHAIMEKPITTGELGSMIDTQLGLSAG
jgi:CheY-like chemotaxis protein